jgi:hypothetical protein
VDGLTPCGSECIERRHLVQKHPKDPPAVPSEPTVGEPEEGMDQEIGPKGLRGGEEPKRGKQREYKKEQLPKK